MNVPEPVSRIACGTSLMSYSSPMPTVCEFIRVTLYRSDTTITPRYVECSGLPPETFSTRTTLPPRPARTVRVCASRSTVETCARPTVNRTSRLWVPNSPGAPWTSFNRSATVTFVPAAQYCCGRKSNRWLPNQCAATTTGGSAPTRTARSTAARSAIGLLKRNETGMPTPTVDPSSGVKKATKVCARAAVENAECWAARCPWPSSATASSVNAVPSGNAPSGTHPAPSGPIVPATSAPLASANRTETNRPCEAVTRTAPSGCTSTAPSAGTTASTARDGTKGTAAAPDATDSPPEAPPPPHPVRTARQQATAATPRAHTRPRRRIPGPPTVHDRRPEQRHPPTTDTRARRAKARAPANNDPTHRNHHPTPLPAIRR